MGGRKRTPTVMRMTMGNPGKRSLPTNEPIGIGELPGPPAHWKPDQKKVWHEIVSRLPLGVATGSDAGLVELTASLLIQARAANFEIPSSLAAQLRYCYAALGLTPADRSKLSVPPDKDDPASEYFT